MLPLAACSNVNEDQPNASPAPKQTVCTLEARAAISVQPVDSRTGEVLSGPTILILSEGTFADTVHATTSSTIPVISGAYERAGTYSILVRHPGYRDYVRTGVTVTRDECHVKPVRITAEMEKM